jgi:hypothetical protein
LSQISSLFTFFEHATPDARGAHPYRATRAAFQPPASLTSSSTV